MSQDKEPKSIFNQEAATEFDPAIFDEIRKKIEIRGSIGSSFVMWNEQIFRAFLENYGETQEYIDNICEEIKAGKHETIRFNQPIPLNEEE